MVKKLDNSSRKRRRLKPQEDSTGAADKQGFSKERRLYERYDTALKIQFYVNFDLETKIDFRVKRENKKDFSKGVYSAVSKNVSVEGICFSSEKKLRKGDVLLLDVYVPSASKPIKMLGHVRWSQPIDAKAKNVKYDTGVKVTAVNEELVEKTIFIDDIYHVAWSIVLESVFGGFKHLALERKRAA